MNATETSFACGFEGVLVDIEGGWNVYGELKLDPDDLKFEYLNAETVPANEHIRKFVE